MEFLAFLRRDLDAFEACLRSDLTTPIEHCGDWTLYDLADHLGNGNLWSAVAITEKHGKHKGAPAPRDPAELRRWFNETSETLLTALETDPSTEAWTFYPPRTVAFWRRRRALETAVHRWDAEHATGAPSPLDPALAADGVSEAINDMFPRQVRLSRATAPDQAIRLVATDMPQTWTLGPGTPVATLHGPAPTLFLMLWKRVSPQTEAIEWEGDQKAALKVLDRPITP